LTIIVVKKSVYFKMIECNTTVIAIEKDMEYMLTLNKRRGLPQEG